MKQCIIIKVPMWHNLLRALSLLVVASVLFSHAGNLAFAADSVVVQTFTFDSIICRQAKFKFPAPDEKFYKVIGRYRLKCDPKTQHDKFNCGEWDYHAYTRLLYPPADSLLYNDTQFPASTFGALLPTASSTLQLCTNKVMDKHRYTLYHINTTSSNEVKHTIRTGDTAISSYGNHQFLLVSSELSSNGLKANDKIGKIIIGANISDTMRNVVVRAKHQTGPVLPITYSAEGFDTLTILNNITPQDCVEGKVTINFMKDFVWNGNNGIIFEILCNSAPKSGNSFKVNVVNGRKSHIGKQFTAAVFSDTNAWIDVDYPNIANALKNQFTIEGWFHVNSADSSSLDNAVLFSIGDRFTVRLGSDSTRNKLHIEKFNDENQINYTNSDCIVYDSWQHVAVVFDGKQPISPERLKVFINGENVPLHYAAWGVNSGWSEANSYVHHYLDSTQANFTIGNRVASDTKNNFRGAMALIRVWDTAMKVEDIIDNINLTNIETSNKNYNNLLVNLNFDVDYATRTIPNDVNSSHVSARVIGEIYFDKNMTIGIGPMLSLANRAFLPEIELVTGDFEYNNTSEEIEIEMEQIPLSLVTFDTTAKAHPTIKNIVYYYKPLQNVFDANRTLIETIPLDIATTPVTSGDVLYTYHKRIKTAWNVFEIGRYITPYGVNLSLGEDGFEYEYDYTDYMNILRDSVTLTAHNLQELIDLKFVFYKGEPTRNVIKITEPWGTTQHTVRYSDLVADKSFAAPITVPIQKETKSVKLKTRITGHGMERSNINSNVQCCEFYENIHSLAAELDGEMQDVGRWKIWKDCTENPVYPQGGTWVYAREGWCPGETVKEYEYELTPYIKKSSGTNDSLKLKYNISDDGYKYDSKLGDGYYTMGMQLVEYSESIYKNDLELYKVTHPSIEDMYSRYNPICNGIEIVVRNNSDETITKFSVEIEAKDNTTEETITIIQQVNRQVKPHSFWTEPIYMNSDEADRFWKVAASSSPSVITVRVKDPQNASSSVDDNPSNNEITQEIVLPDIFNKNNLTLKYKTNLRPTAYNVRLYDINGDIVKTYSATTENTEYLFKFDDLPNGCYTFEIEDRNGFEGAYCGLSWWNSPKQGNGSIGFYDSTGKKGQKVFNPDFGRRISYSFVLNHFTSIKEDKNLLLSVYPNPASDLLFIQEGTPSPDKPAFYGLPVNVDIYDVTGNIILSHIGEPASQIALDISQLPAGAYSIRITCGKRISWAKFVKQG